MIQIYFQAHLFYCFCEFTTSCEECQAVLSILIFLGFADLVTLISAGSKIEDEGPFYNLILKIYL
jgi:hypothetical protein